MRELDFSGVNLTGNLSQLGRGITQSLIKSEEKQNGLFEAMKLHDLVLPPTRNSGGRGENKNDNEAAEITGNGNASGRNCSSVASPSTRVTVPLNANTAAVATLLQQVKIFFQSFECFC